MEKSHSLCLNEEAFKAIPANKQHIFIFEWLQYLNKILVSANKVSINNINKVSSS